MIGHGNGNETSASIVIIPSMTAVATTSQAPRFRFVELFAGIGGMHAGAAPLGGECVFASEWNRYSRQTYAANFGVDEAMIAGDITKIAAEEVPDHDLLLAGFPCQPFSIAGVSKKTSMGRRHGFDDPTQGTLFFDVVRILELRRPRAFVLENVKHLLNHDRGRTLAVIRSALEERLGYAVAIGVVSARPFVPQARERVFIVGLESGAPFDFSDVIGPSWDEGPRLGSILHPEDGTEQPDEPFTFGSDGVVNPKYTLSQKLWDYLQAYAAKHRAAGNGFGFGLVGPDDVARTLSARYHKDGSEILVSQAGGAPRRLTPREAARLMGFDQPGASDWVIPVSDTQAYMQFGNAVVPEVVTAVLRPLIARLRTPGVPHAPAVVPAGLPNAPG